jgi:hypothetical protein
VEPELDVVVHHFQFRVEELTRAKLAVASGDRSETRRRDNAFDRRMQSVDAVYAGDWEHVVPRIPQPRPWADLGSVLRWYDRPGLVPPAGAVTRAAAETDHTS